MWVNGVRSKLKGLGARFFKEFLRMKKAERQDARIYAWSWILNDNICQIRQDKNAASLTSVKNIVDTILNCILVTGRVLSLVFAN